MYCLLETILKDRSLSSVSNNLYWGHSHEHTVAWCMNLLLQCWGPLLSQILHWIRDSLYADTRGVSVSLDTLRSYSHPRVHSPGMPRNHLLRPETSDGSASPATDSPREAARGAADAGRALGLRVPATRPESRSWVRGRESHSCLPLEGRRGPPSRGLGPKNRATKPSNFPFWLVPFACPLSDWGGLRRKMSFIYGGGCFPLSVASSYRPLTNSIPFPPHRFILPILWVKSIFNLPTTNWKYFWQWVWVM